MPIICPCCSQPLIAQRAPIQALSAAPLPKMQRTIVDALAHAYPRGLDIEYLVDVLYGDDPEGGPEDAANVLKTTICRLRKNLVSYGWQIPQNNGGSGNYGRYKLAPLPAEKANAA